MKQRIITGVAFTGGILLFVLPAYFWPFFFILLWLLVAIISTHELVAAVKYKKLAPSAILAYAGALLAFVPLLVAQFSTSLVWGFAAYSMAVLLFIMFTVIFSVIRNHDHEALADGIATACIILYVSFPLASASVITLFVPDAWFFLVMGLFAPWVSDVFAYFSGSLLGKHKIVPHISPKKTWEGCIGGALGTALVVALYFSLLVDKVLVGRFSDWSLIWAAALTGLLLSVFSQLGDWLASAIKRWAGIKDFGSFLPGHGGLLDRFDSVFFTLPATLIISFWLI